MTELFSRTLACGLLLTNIAKAEEIYLRCELRNWCCNPVTYRIDLDNSFVFIGDSESAHRALITRYKISVLFPNYGPRAGHFINRMTLDLEFNGDTKVWAGTCVKIDGPKI